MVGRRWLGAALASGVLLLAGCGGTTGGSTATAPKAATAKPAAGTPATATNRPAAAQRQQVTILLPWLVSGYDAAFYVGMQKGIYAKQGIDLKVIPGKGSANTVQAIGHGTYKFGLADAATTAIGTTKGLPVEVVADYFQISPDGIIVLDRSHITKPSDLLGKRVAVSPGGTDPHSFKAFMAVNHLDPSRITEINMAPTALISSLLTGKVDGIGDYGTSVLPQLAAKGAKASELYYAKWGVPMLSNGLIVNTDFARANPGLVRRVVQATDAAWAYTAQHPDQAVAALNQAVAQPPASVARSLRLSLTLLHTANTRGRPVGWMSPKDWKTTLHVLSAYEGLTGIRAPGAYYTDAYIGS